MIPRINGKLNWFHSLENDELHLYDLKKLHGFCGCEIDYAWIGEEPPDSLKCKICKEHEND